MSLKGTRVTVAATVTLLAQPYSESTIWDPMPVMVTNRGAQSIFLGGPTVDTTTGYEVAVNETVGLQLINGDVLYGIVSAGTCRVDVMKGRQS